MKDYPKQYRTAEAFRAALEKRLYDISQQEATNLQRLRRQISFDRLLVRLFPDEKAPWILKGGYALELRLQNARTTKDIDLSIPDEAAGNIKRNILEQLRNRIEVNLDDFFTFSIGKPKANIFTAPEGGSRYPITASVANRIFTTFHLDVGIGDPLIHPPERVKGRDWLGFAGIAPGIIFAISKEQQFAEKLHAYTMPRKSENSRVKDLIDLALLSLEGLNSDKIQKAIKAVFSAYSMHPIPHTLPAPPQSWGQQYLVLSKECGLELPMEDSLKLVESAMKPPNIRRGISM